MVELFANSAKLIVFLHVASAFIWIGGMVALRFALHPTLHKSVSDEYLRVNITLSTLKTFFNIVIPTILLLVLTAVIMAVGMGFKGTPLYMVVHIKEGIWTVMTLIFIAIYIKRNRAERAFKSGDLELAKRELAILPKYLLPINIILGFVALYFGITLRGF